jgi:hypothetical protein
MHRCPECGEAVSDSAQAGPGHWHRACFAKFMKRAERDPLLQPAWRWCARCDEQVDDPVYWYGFSPYHRACLEQKAAESRSKDPRTDQLMQASFQAVLSAPSGHRPVWFHRESDWDAAHRRFILDRYQCDPGPAELVLKQLIDDACDGLMIGPGLHVTDEGEFVVPPGRATYIDLVAAEFGLTPRE